MFALASSTTFNTIDECVSGECTLAERCGSLQRDTGLPSLFPGGNRGRHESSILGQHTSELLDRKPIAREIGVPKAETDDRRIRLSASANSSV